MDKLNYSNNTSYTLFGLVALIAVTLDNSAGIDIIDAVIHYLMN